jgi:hypothetical protein
MLNQLFSRLIIALFALAILSAPTVQAKKRLLSKNSSEEEIETQRVDEDSDDSERVGKKAASRYFEKSEKSEKKRSVASGPADHYLAIHLGFFLDSDAYNWGSSPAPNSVNYNHVDDPGKLNIGVTYRMGEWTSSMDLNLRAEFQTFQLGDEKPLKLSIMPLITFPDSNSQFPLYFGAGAGPGIFFKQSQGESAISIDYQLLAGARMFDVVENTGFFIEFGLKNHLLLLSDGQYNGVFVSTGALFTF